MGSFGNFLSPRAGRGFRAVGEQDSVRFIIVPVGHDDIISDMNMARIVLDTHVLVATSLSRNGAYFALLQA